MVLFTSRRPLERAENIKAVYDAYDGAKEFARMDREIPDLHSGKYRLQVTDELPSDTIGKCLFIGHGMTPCKTYGLQQPHPYFNRPDLVTCAIASSKRAVSLVAKYSGISEEQVKPIGMPRTDAYFNRLPKEKGNYLYVPTFRPYKWWVPDWGSIKRCLNDDETFIVKPHMLTGRLMQKEYKNITEADSMIPSADYLMRAEVVITDYSTIMFDAYVMRTPVVLFAKDKFKYLRTRGVYYPYPESYADYFCDNEDALTLLVRQARWTPHMEELREFYTGACDGRSTERTIELIRSML